MTKFCIVPLELAGKPEERLREEYSHLTVILDRRCRDRRRTGERRVAPGDRLDRDERRCVRNKRGLRIGERRAPVVALPLLPLPRALKRHADRIAFVERVAPSARYAEDLAASRLVARFQCGDPRAFERLYQLYFDRVYRYMCAALRNRHDAEDRVQQVFTKAFAALPRYEIAAGRPLRRWLFRIARNDLLTALDAQRRLIAADPEWIDRQREDASLPPLEHTLKWLSDEEIAMFVERLPLQQQQALMLRYMLELDTAEIAEVLDLSPANVRQLEHRALRFLEERLASLGRAPRKTSRAATVSLLRQAPVLRMRRFALA